MSQALLLVEDDSVLANMYRTLLQNHGYNVKTAGNGEEGLKVAFKEHPELVLLDVLMPKMDGMTMLSKLRQNDWGKNVKVIVLTNVDPSEDTILKGIVKDYPTYYLIKSNNKPEEVLEQIKEVLGEEKEGDTING